MIPRVALSFLGWLSCITLMPILSEGREQADRVAIAVIILHHFTSMEEAPEPRPDQQEICQSGFYMHDINSTDMLYTQAHHCKPPARSNATMLASPISYTLAP